MATVPMHIRLPGAAELSEHADVAGEQRGHEHGPDNHGYNQQQVHLPLARHSSRGGWSLALNYNTFDRSFRRHRTKAGFNSGVWKW